MDHLDPANHPLTFNDLRHEWSHGNTVVPVPGKGAAGAKVLVSFRNISTVLLIDKASGRIDWELGPPLLAQQHDPNLLDNGNLLVFDNGCHRSNISLAFSRVLEIVPESGKIEWVYQDLPWTDFFSPFISGARRLPNGNTLITEGCTGRMFQVTSVGEVVWEFVNPHVGPDPRGAVRDWPKRGVPSEPLRPRRNPLALGSLLFQAFGGLPGWPQPKTREVSRMLA